MICILFSHILQNSYGFDRKEASLGTAFLLFGSLLIPNARDFYSECFGSLLALLALSRLSAHCTQSGNALNLRNLFFTVLPAAVLIALSPISFGSIVVLIVYMFRVCSREKAHGVKLSRMMTLPPSVTAAILSLLLGVSFLLGENYLRREGR